MSLSYNEACPPLYQPPGFVDKDDFQEGDAEAMRNSLEESAEDIVGTFETNHYQIRVAACLSSAPPQDSSVDFRDTEMSKQLQAMQKTSSSYSNNLLSTLRGSPPAVKRRSNAPILNGKRVKVNTPQPLSKGSRQHLTSAPTLKSSQSLRASSLAESESSELIKSPMVSVVAGEISPETTPFWVGVEKMAELLVHCYAIQSGKAGNNGGVFEPGLLAEGRIKRLNRASDINCECGNERVSATMVRIHSPDILY
jgi:hypothetical protein